MVVTSESESESAGQARPVLVYRAPATAFATGIGLIAIIGGSIAILFLFSRSQLALGLAGVGIAAGVFGLITLVYGNWRRFQLIFEFTTRASEIMAWLDRLDDDQEGPPRRAVNLLENYEDALTRLAAYDQASWISEYLIQRGYLRPDIG